MSLPPDIIKMIISYVSLRAKLRMYVCIDNHKLRNCLKSDIQIVKFMKRYKDIEIDEFLKRYKGERRRLMIEHMKLRGIPLNDINDALRNYIVYCKLCNAPVRKFNMKKHLKKHAEEPPRSEEKSWWWWSRQKGDMISHPRVRRCRKCKLVLAPYGIRLPWWRRRTNGCEEHKCPFN